jgi:glutamyl endopeptidase
MRHWTRLLLIAGAIPITSAAIAAPGDRPISPGGAGGPAPTAEAGAMVAPSRGAGSTDVGEIAASGATVGPSGPFPANGLATVAYGKGGASPESIINWDSRTRAYTTAYPNRAIVFIELNGAHLCTGWLYSPRDIVTAGHCVHTGGPGGAWRNRTLMRVYAGKDGASNPFGSCTVARLSSVIGWTQNGDVRFDYGHMRLNCTVGNTVGWFGLYTHASPTNQPAIITGYPGDKPRTQWTSADKIRSFSNEMLAYRMDTIGGHSGSPIWHDRSEALSTNGAWGFGVHNYGVGTFGTQANSAARLTSVRIQNYINWRDRP